VGVSVFGGGGGGSSRPPPKKKDAWNKHWCVTIGRCATNQLGQLSVVSLEVWKISTNQLLTVAVLFRQRNALAMRHWLYDLCGLST